jgi:hypothetical protein
MGMKKKSKKSRSLSDDAFNQKLQESIQVIQEMELEKCLILLQQLLNCDEHEQILKGDLKLSFFIHPIHEYFYVLEKPNVDYIKIKKELHVVFKLMAALNKVLGKIEDAIEFYKREHILTKVDPIPLMKISKLYFKQHKYFEMQKYLMMCKPLLGTPEQILDYYEIWADYFISQGELEKGCAYVKMVEIYTTMLDLDFYRIFEKYKAIYNNKENKLKELQTTEDAVIECWRLNIQFIRNKNWLKAAHLWKRSKSNQGP